MNDVGTARFADSKSRSRQASGTTRATSSQSTLSSSFEGKTSTGVSGLGLPGIVPFKFGTFPKNQSIRDEMRAGLHSKKKQARPKAYNHEQSTFLKNGERSLRRLKHGARGISIGVSNLLDIWEFFELTDEGGIDKVGFEMGLAQLGVDEGACNLENVFTELDENNDKIIDKNEFCQLVKAQIENLSPEVAKLRQEIERTVTYSPQAREQTVENIIPLKEMDDAILKGESSQSSEPRIKSRIKRNMCKDIFRSLDFRHRGYLDIEEFLVALSRMRFQNVEKYRSTFEQYVTFQSPVIDLEDLMVLVYYISGDEPLEPRLWAPLKERDTRLVFEDLDYKKKGLTAFEVGLAAERLGILSQTLKELFSKYSGGRSRIGFSAFNRMLSKITNSDRCHPTRRPKIPVEPHNQIHKSRTIDFAIDEVFSQLDHSSTGTINSQEFLIGCSWLGLNDSHNNISEFNYRSTDDQMDKDGFQGAIESLAVRHNIRIGRLCERLAFEINDEASQSYVRNMELVDFDKCHFVNLAESIVAAQRMEIKFDLSWIQTHFATYDYTSSGWINKNLYVSLMAELETKSDPTKPRYPSSGKDRRAQIRKESLGIASSGWGSSHHVKPPDMNLQASSRLRPPQENSLLNSAASSPLVSGKRFPSNRSDGSRTSKAFDRIKSLLNYSPRDLDLKTNEKLELKKRDREIEELKRQVQELSSKVQTESMRHRNELEVEKEKLSLKTIAIESNRDQQLATMAKNQLSMESELQEQMAEVRDLKKRLTESENEKVQLQKEIRQELAELEEEYVDLESELDMCLKENSYLKDELEEINRKYQELEEDFENIETKNAELREKLQQAKKDHKKISEKYKEQTREIEQLQQAAFEAMDTSYYGRRDSEVFKVRTFNETIKFLQDNTNVMSTLKELWKDKKNGYKRRILDLKNEIRHLRKNYEKLKKTVRVSRSETEKSSYPVGHTNTRLRMQTL